LENEDPLRILQGKSKAAGQWAYHECRGLKQRSHVQYSQSIDFLFNLSAVGSQQAYIYHISGLINEHQS
jgi:hypothetical protein